MPAPTSSTQTDRIDTLLAVLTSNERRAIITHLQETSEDVVSLEDLATTLAAQNGQNRARQTPTPPHPSPNAQ